MEHFAREHRIKMLKTQGSVTFAHKKSVDDPKSHALHINNYIEVYIYISGDVDYIVGDSYYCLREGDIIVINPHEVHRAVIKSPAEYERFYILLPTDSFDGFLFDPLEKILQKPETASAVISLPQEKWSQAKSLLYSIDELCRHGNDADSLAAFSEVMRLMCLIDSCNLSEKSEALRRSEQLPTLVRDVLTYIDRELTDIAQISDIATALHVTLPYLSALFKTHIGVNMSSYLRARKVAHAKRLLDDGATVTEACFDSGFSDCSYFIKCFKAHVGVTPLKYSQSRRKLFDK